MVGRLLDRGSSVTYHHRMAFFDTNERSLEDKALLELIRNLQPSAGQRARSEVGPDYKTFIQLIEPLEDPFDIRVIAVNTDRRLVKEVLVSARAPEWPPKVRELTSEEAIKFLDRDGDE